MKKRRLKVSVMLLFALCITGLQAQNLFVVDKSYHVTFHALKSLQKITYVSDVDELKLTEKDNSSTNYPLSLISFMTFYDVGIDLVEINVSNDQVLSVYPNPVSDILNMELSGKAQGKGTLSILNFEGKTLLSQEANHAGIQSLDVSTLPKGIYLCRYANTAEIKIVKFIKL